MYIFQVLGINIESFINVIHFGISTFLISANAGFTKEEDISVKRSFHSLGLQTYSSKTSVCFSGAMTISIIIFKNNLFGYLSGFQQLTEYILFEYELPI